MRAADSHEHHGWRSCFRAGTVKPTSCEASGFLQVNQRPRGILKPQAWEGKGGVEPTQWCLGRQDWAEGSVISQLALGTN